MNVEKQPSNCEDLLALLTGISIPKPIFAKELDHGYVMHNEDVKILKSIAKQLSKGTAMTDRQYNLVKRKIETYREQFANNGIDIDLCMHELMHPLREIDRSHWIKILTYNDEDMLAIRFPFSKKIISRLDELRMLDLHVNHAKLFKNNTHYFHITPKNLYGLVNIAKRFDTKFFISKEILETYDKLQEYETDRIKYVPGVYDYQIKNLPQEAIEDLESNIGKPKDNLALYYDRRYLYGLSHFDNKEVEKALFDLSPLANSIVQRSEATVLIPSSKFPIDEVVSTIHELQRFPMLVVLDNKSALNGLKTVYDATINFTKTEDISVLFRLDGENNEFNQYVKDKKINNKVANNTKIVYISTNKLPKPLLQSGWIPSCTLSFGSKGLHFNNVTSYIQQFDLQIVYEDASSNTYWNRTERKLIHGFV